MHSLPNLQLAKNKAIWKRTKSVTKNIKAELSKKLKKRGDRPLND
jgi:hypothetical protein